MGQAMAPLAQHLDIAHPLSAKRFVMDVMDLQLLVRPVKRALFAAIIRSRELTDSQAQPVPRLQVFAVVSPEVARHISDIGARAEPLHPLSRELATLI